MPNHRYDLTKSLLIRSKSILEAAMSTVNPEVGEVVAEFGTEPMRWEVALKKAERLLIIVIDDIEREMRKRGPVQSILKDDH